MPGLLLETLKGNRQAKVPMWLMRQAGRAASRLLNGRGHRQGLRWLRKMRTWLGRLTRDIRRKIDGMSTPEQKSPKVPE